MEAGYHSHLPRLGVETHYSGDNSFPQSGGFMGFPSSYYYASPPPIKPRCESKSEHVHSSEPNSEDSLTRKLNALTEALNQGKPIRVDDLMSLRPDNEVGNVLLDYQFYFKVR